MRLYGFNFNNKGQRGANSIFSIQLTDTASHNTALLWTAGVVAAAARKENPTFKWVTFFFKSSINSSVVLLCFFHSLTWGSWGTRLLLQCGQMVVEQVTPDRTVSRCACLLLSSSGQPSH